MIFYKTGNIVGTDMMRKNIKRHLLNRLLIVLSGIFCFSFLQAQKAELIVDRLSGHWLDLHNNFSQTQDVWGNYTLDLSLEALLFYDHYTNSHSYTDIVLEVFEKRNIRPEDTIDYQKQPFCSINFTLGKLTDNAEWFTSFIYESYRMFHTDIKSDEGAVLIHTRNDYFLLIDYMQEYASRLAKTGYLTQDTMLFRESVDQFLIYEQILRNTSTGLWHQGRGWCENRTQISEGTWSRGQGWLLRGLVTTLLHLPEKFREELIPVLQRHAGALVKVQSENGMYHILLNLPENKSAPDVSGTGMIAYYMSVAVQEGWLNKKDFEAPILHAAKGIKSLISETGEILSSGKGPGPLCTQDEYIHYKPEKDEIHGFQGAIYGMIAEYLMLKKY